MPDAGLWSTHWAAAAALAPVSVMVAGASLLAGAALGVVFFGGLWWTVQRGAASPAAARWFLGSLVLRSALVLAGFYLMGAGQPARLALCLPGFVLARAVVLRATRPTPATVVTGVTGVTGVTVVKPACRVPPCV